MTRGDDLLDPSRSCASLETIQDCNNRKEVTSHQLRAILALMTSSLKLQLNSITRLLFIEVNLERGVSRSGTAHDQHELGFLETGANPIKEEVLTLQGPAEYCRTLQGNVRYVPECSNVPYGRVVRGPKRIRHP